MLSGPLVPPLPGSRPDGPSPAWWAWCRAQGRRLILLPLLLLLALPLGLSGCSGAGQPPQRVLLSALALQIQLTQGAIARALDLEPPGTPEVSRVRVDQQEPIRIGDAPGLQLRGRFDWRLEGGPFRTDTPFELYLARGERAESWRLARPVGSQDGSTQEWITDPLPLPSRSRGLATPPRPEADPRPSAPLPPAVQQLLAGDAPG